MKLKKVVKSKEEDLLEEMQEFYDKCETNYGLELSNSDLLICIKALQFTLHPPANEQRRVEKYLKRSSCCELLHLRGLIEERLKCYD